jgi:hypothetical protein
MSLNLPQVKAVKVMDPRLEINTQRDYVALRGSLVNSCQQFPATNVNNNSVQITCNPPSRKIAISRLIYQLYSFSFTITGTNTSGGSLLNPGYIAPRAHAIEAVQNSLQMTIDNDTLTEAPKKQFALALKWYNDPHKNRFGQGSLELSMNDQFQNYSDGAGSIRNPLAPYNDNSFEDTRGGYAGFVINPQTANNTTATGTLTVYQPLDLSPFVSGCESNYTSCLIGVQNMAYTATLGDLTRCLSIIQNQGTSGTINITGVSVNLVGASLLFNYLTPSPTEPLPNSLVSSYFSPVSYPTKTSASIPPGGSVSITMQSIQVTSIPRRAYIFARLDDNAQTAFTSDAYLALNPSVNPLTVTWNNNQFFSQYTTQDIYNMSVKNGLQMSYSQFVNYTGSVIAIEFGSDLGLMPDESPGVLGNYQFSLTAQFVNTNTVNSVVPTMYVVVMYEGTFNVIDGNSSHMIGVLSRADVLNSQKNPLVTYKLAESVHGGDFFSSLKGALGKVHNFVKDNRLVSKGLRLFGNPAAQVASHIAESAGYGMSGGKRRKMSKKHLKHLLRGSGLSGQQQELNSENEFDEGSDFEQ